MKKNLIALLIVVILIGSGILLGNIISQNAKTFSETIGKEKIIVYKTPHCGCCGNYVAYLRRKGLTVEVNDLHDLTELKTRYRIPRDLESCHTTVAGDYVVEGHMPVEAMSKLLKEKPEISGIALPGMPAGSPGMPGGRSGAFEVHSITKDGIDGGLFGKF